MPKFKDHLLHSKQRHPDIPEKRHEAVHKWMDDPANWPVDKPYASGFIRRRGRSGHDHREIRHNPKKVEKALGGGNREAEKQVRSIAKCHVELDGISNPSIFRKIVEAEHFEKTNKFKNDPLIKVVTSLKRTFIRIKK